MAMGTNTTRCGRGCNGSTTKNAIVYFPPGEYLVSSTIALPFGTQVIGDAKNRPRIVAAPSFVGLGVLSTDEYTGDGGTGSDGNAPQYVPVMTFTVTETCHRATGVTIALINNQRLTTYFLLGTTSTRPISTARSATSSLTSGR